MSRLVVLSGDERRVVIHARAPRRRSSRLAQNSLHRRISTPHASSSRIIARNHSNDATAHSSARSGGSVRVRNGYQNAAATLDVVPRSSANRPPPRARARIVHTLRRARAPPTCRSRPRRRRPLRSARIARKRHHRRRSFELELELDLADASPRPSATTTSRAKTTRDDTRSPPSFAPSLALAPLASASTAASFRVDSFEPSTTFIDADSTWRRRAPRTRPKTCARTRCSTMTITSTPWRPRGRETDVVVDVFVRIAQGPEDRLGRDRRL